MNEIVNYIEVWGWNYDEQRILFAFWSVIVQFPLDDSVIHLYKIWIYANLYAIFLLCILYNHLLNLKDSFIKNIFLEFQKRL